MPTTPTPQKLNHQKLNQGLTNYAKHQGYEANENYTGIWKQNIRISRINHRIKNEKHNELATQKKMVGK